MYILQHLQILVIKKFKDVGVTRKFKELTAWLVKVSQLNLLIHMVQVVKLFVMLLVCVCMIIIRIVYLKLILYSTFISNYSIFDKI